MKRRTAIGGGNISRMVLRRWIAAILFAAAWAVTFSASPLRASPSQEDVFRSIQDNVGHDDDSPMLLPLLCAAGGAVILLVIWNQRREQQVVRATTNNPGKLLREIEKKAGLKKNEMRQLRMLANEIPDGDPLLMLVCPSLLGNALKNCHNRKLDRRLILTAVARLRNAHIGVAKPGMVKPTEVSTRPRAA